MAIQIKKNIITLLTIAIFFISTIYPLVLANADNEPDINYMFFYPSPPLTIRDNIYAYANVTSSTELKSVTLYLAISSTRILDGSNLNYKTLQMQSVNDWKQNTPQTWSVDLPQIINSSYIEFFSMAIDRNNQTGSYYSRENPRIIPINEVPKPYISYYSISISSLDFKNYGSLANLTFNIQGQFPYPQFGPGIPVNLSAYSVSNHFGMREYEGIRFWYVYQSSGEVTLNGDVSQYPYDNYKIELEISIPYPNATLLETNKIPLSQSLNFLNTQSDLWNITNSKQNFYHEGNDTKMQLTYNLNRLRSPIDPLLLVGFTNFILLASAMMFSVKDIDKRLQVYLAAVIVPITVLLGVKLNPFGFGITIYERYFSYVMLATASLISVSILAYRLKIYRISNWLDLISGVGVCGAGLYLFFNTSIPPLGKMPIFIFLLAPLLIKIIEYRKKVIRYYKYRFYYKL